MTDPENPGSFETPPAPAPPEPQVEIPPSAPDRYPFWTYKDLLLLTAMAVPLALCTAMLVAIAFMSMDWTPSAKALGPIAATFLFYGVWFLVLYEVIHLRYGRPFWLSLRWVRSTHSVARCLLWGFATALGCIALGVILRPPEIKAPLYQLLQDRTSIILMGIFAVSLGPLCEELAFRGFLMPLLVRSLGAIGGVVLQAVPFALLHGAEYAWSWQHLTIIFTAGVAFGWMRYTSGSTAAATYMHGAYNLTFFAGLLAERYASRLQP